MTRSGLTSQTRFLANVFTTKGLHMPWEKDPSVVSESVVFNGRTYNRYPASPRRAHRVYFMRSGGKFFLHRDIWEFHNGEVPDGHHVHHINGDPLDNRIENLQCLPAGAHFKEHTQDRRGHGLSTKNLAHLESIRDLAKARWEHLNQNPHSLACLECGGTFQSASGRATLCSNTCAARKSRRQRKLEHI